MIGRYSDATTRFVVRFTRAGSVTDSITIRAGIAMITKKPDIKVALMSNSKITPPRISSISPGWYRWK